MGSDLHILKPILLVMGNRLSEGKKGYWWASLEAVVMVKAINDGALI